MSEYIFVYGTLKEDMRNNNIISKIGELNSPAVTISKYPMYASEYNFPYLENRPGEGNYIEGEIWEVEDDKICELDYFEGVPDLYKKGTITVEFENLVMECLVYFKSEETENTTDLLSEWKD